MVTDTDGVFKSNSVNKKRPPSLSQSVGGLSQRRRSAPAGRGRAAPAGKQLGINAADGDVWLGAAVRSYDPRHA